MGTCLSLGGFDLDVYKFDGTTYQRVIHFTRANNWFGGASIVSRDGSTVGSFAGNFTNWLSGEVVLFDVASAQMIGSYPVSGTGSVSRHSGWRGVQRQRHSDGFRFLGYASSMIGRK